MPANRLPSGSHHSSVGSLLEQRNTRDAKLLCPILSHGHQRGHAVAHAAPKVDARRLLEVTHGYRDVAEFEAEMHALSEELGIEYEVFRVVHVRHGFKHFAPIRSEAAVE